jgi:hypothetical protein
MLTDINPRYAEMIMQLIKQFNDSDYQGQIARDAAFLSEKYDKNTLDFKDERVHNFVKMFDALWPSATIETSGGDKFAPAKIVEPYYQSLDVDPYLFGQQQQ